MFNWNTLAFEIALFSFVGHLKHPVAVPILFVMTVARSQNRPVMFGDGPNIQGEINPLSGKNPYTHGAFQLGNSYLNDDRSSGSDAGSTQLTFSAARFSTIYSGSSMQPKALQVLACIRV